MNAGRFSRFGRVAVGMALLGLGAMAAYAEAVWVDGETDIWVQNIDRNENANVLADFYPVTGAPPTTILAPDLLAPGETFAFRSPFNPVGAIGQFAVIVRSNRRTAAVNRTREPITGAAVMYNNVDVADSLVVPLVALAFSNPTDVTSIISVQSTEKNPNLRLTAELFSKTYYRQLQGTQFSYLARPNTPIVVSTFPNRNTGGTWQVDLTQPEFDDAIADQQPSPAPGINTGTLGWMRIKPEQIAACAQVDDPDKVCKIGAESFINLRTVNTAVSGFAGVPESHKSRRLFMPLFRANFFGTTGFSIVNPGPNAVRIKTTYLGADQSTDPACRGQSFVHRAPDGSDTIAIPANDSVVLFHIPGNPPPPAPGNVGNSTLPSGCFGSAIVEVVQGDGVLGMTNDFSVDRNGLPKTAAAYIAKRAEDSATRVGVPMVLHDATRSPGQSTPRITTSVQVMNTEDRPASVTVTFREKPFGQLSTPIPPPAAVTIPPRQSHTFWTGAEPSVRDRTGFEGSAIVESSAKVAVIVTVAEFGRDSVTYNGISAE